MGLVLAPQCCCGRPGFLRDSATYAFAFVHPSELDQFGRLTQWAQWMVPWYAETLPGYDYHGEQHPSEIIQPTWGRHVMGYDPGRERIIYATTANDLYYGSLGGVAAVPLGEMLLGTAPPVTLIGDAAGLAILEGTKPSGGSTSYAVARWSAYSADRLYGFTRWTDYAAGTTVFKAWSTALGGDDYQVAFEIVESSSGAAAPVSMTVIDGQIHACRALNNNAGTEILANGAAVATIPGGGAFLNDAAIVDLAGQLFALGHESPFVFRAVFLLEDGIPAIARRLQFVAIEDGYEVEYAPTGMGWDVREQAIVASWAQRNVWSPGQSARYVTYIRQPLTPGNIVGQTGVDIYNTFQSGGDVREWPHSPRGWGVVISGKLPQPLEVIAGVIEPPPPPPPPQPTCDPIADCETPMVLGAALSELADVAEGPGVDEYGNAYACKTWLYANFLRGFEFHQVSELGGECAGYVGGPYNFWADTGLANNYNDPGILLLHYDFDNPAVKREFYVYGIGLAGWCSEGKFQISNMAILVQEFNQPSPSGGQWPPAAATYKFCITPGIYIDDLSSSGATLSPCSSNIFRARFSFDTWFAGTIGPRWFLFTGNIGAIA